MYMDILAQFFVFELKKCKNYSTKSIILHKLPLINFF